MTCGDIRRNYRKRVREIEVPHVESENMISTARYLGNDARYDVL